MKNKIAFTLIEMVVAMAIVILLTGIGMASYTHSIKKSRDTARIGDMEKIADGLYAYYTQYGQFPTALSALTTNKVMVSVPVDPLDNSSYSYTKYASGDNGCPSNRGAYYILGSSKMETVATNAKHPNNPGFSCSFDTGSLQWLTGRYER